MKNVILDTNFLLVPIKFRIDIFSEIHRICNFNYRLCVYHATVGELKNIVEKQKGKDRKAAQFGLKMIKSKGMKILASDESYVDRLILENIDDRAVVATLDSELRKKLLEKSVPVIMMRQKEYLMFAVPAKVQK
jgi:uncharacterized protein